MALPLIGGVMAGIDLAIGIGKAVAGHSAQDQQYRANRDAARSALRLKRRDLAIRSVEETTAARQQEGLAGEQALIASARTVASAAGAGVRGASVDALQDEIQGDLGRFRDSIDYNLTVTLDQIERMRAGAEAEAQARINSVARPGLLNTALQIGGAALDTYGLFRSYKKPVGLRDEIPNAPDDIQVSAPTHALGGR